MTEDEFIPPILPCATVDDLGGMQYEVNVWAEAPWDYRRCFILKATSDKKAADEGIRLFCKEVEQLGPRKEGNE